MSKKRSLVDQEEWNDPWKFLFVFYHSLWPQAPDNTTASMAMMAAAEEAGTRIFQYRENFLSGPKNCGPERVGEIPWFFSVCIRNSGRKYEKEWRN